MCYTEAKTKRFYSNRSLRMQGRRSIIVCSKWQDNEGLLLIAISNCDRTH